MLSPIKKASSLLDTKTGSYETSGSTRAAGEVEAGNQHVDTSHAGNVGPTFSKGDHFEAGASTGSVSTSGQVGGVNWQAGVSGPELKVDGGAKATIGTGGIDVKADVKIDASLVKAGASAEKVIPVTLPGGEKLQIKVNLGALGEVGANGDLHVNVHLGTDGKVTCDAYASGFVGAQAGLTGAIEVDHGHDTIAKASATLSAYAGAGASAEFHGKVGFDGVDFGAKAAAVAGAGFGVDLEGSFSPKATLGLVGAVAKDLAAEGLKSGLDGAKDAGHDVVDWGSSAGSTIADGAGKLGHAIGGLFS